LDKLRDERTEYLKSSGQAEKSLRLELAAEEVQKTEMKARLHQVETQLEGYRTSLETAK